MLMVLAMGPQPETEELPMAEVVRGNNRFALELYGELRRGRGNLFCSPFSISTALAMTYAGARGETAEQMAGTLHFPLPPSGLHAAFARPWTPRARIAATA
jgi:serpin B